MLYKQPDTAFGVLDHEGVGYLTLSSILNSFVKSRANLSPEEISAFFELQNIFKNGEG